MAALEALDAAEFKARSDHRGEGPVLLSDVLRSTGVTLERVAPDVERISLADAERDEAVQLGKSSADDGAELNEQGDVLFPPETDRAELVTSPYHLEAHYLRAVEAGFDEGREAFEEDFRAHAREGIDLVSTLERAKQQEGAEYLRAETERRAACAEERERQERAERRETERQIRELRERP